MHFTIITPSFNQLDYLKRCVASVADQVPDGALKVENVEASGVQDSLNEFDDLNDLNETVPVSIHHHIQDGGSTDGTAEWLERYANENVDTTSPSRNQTSDEDIASTNGNNQQSTYQLTFACEVDNGMYDALNRGIDRCLKSEFSSLKSTTNPQSTTINRENEVFAWLNCDEQYLPGTLQKVAAFFTASPDVDILFGGILMVDPAGELLACRKAMPMRRLFLEASYLYNYSCAMFVREPLWNKLGGFDTAYRNAGDEELVRRSIKLGARSQTLGDYLSAFTYSESNLSSGGEALEEHETLKRSGSMASRRFKMPINLLRLAEKWMRGGHRQESPVVYECYTDAAGERTIFRGINPRCRWPDAHKPYLLSHRLR